ncbi:MAG: hypothetical protein QXW75_00520 [Thermoplasmatales archaeon]
MEKELVEIKIDRVELTMGGNINDAHIAEYWEPYVYGAEIPEKTSAIVPYEVIRETERVYGEFFEREYYVRAWSKNMPFITRERAPISFDDLLGSGLLTTSSDRTKSYVVREIFGKLMMFSGEGYFHDFSPQKRISEEEFFQNAITSIRIERESLMPKPRPQGNEAMWLLEELRNKFIQLRSALYWLGYDLAGIDESAIETYYDDMITRALELKGTPELRKRRWFQNNLSEIEYLFAEHKNHILSVPENGFISTIAYIPSVSVPKAMRKTSDEIVNRLNDMRLNLLGAGRTWVPDAVG